MTLYLQVTQIKNLSSNIYVYVEGSQAGPLISRKTAPVGFKIICSRLDILTIKIFDETFRLLSTSKPLGETEFSAARFIRENKTNPKLYTDILEYQTKIYNERDQQVGILTLHISYNKAQLYQGEKVGIFESLPQREPVKIYTGTCETRNLFNYFDSGNDDKKCTIVERTYRDETWGNQN